MAYSEKYYISYCDDFGTTNRVSILKKDYVGAATELTGDVTPIVISYDSTDDFKFSPIRPSTAEVFMIFDTQAGPDFEELWTADEREYKVEHKINSVVDWAGFIIPDGFSYAFVGGKYQATIKAADGLSTLESYIFIDDNQKPYGNQDLVYNGLPGDVDDLFWFPPSLIATEILRKLDLNLDLWACVDNYERTMLKTGDVREADPLSACLFNVKTYIKSDEKKDIPYWYGSGEEWNCKEVLENLLYVFGAKIYQEHGTWRIKTINTDVDYGTGATQRYWRKYLTTNVYFGRETVNDTINIPCNSTESFLLENDHTMSMDDVYKAFRINYEYSFIRSGDSPVNLVSNGGFTNFNNTSTLAAPDGWFRAKMGFSESINKLGANYIRLQGVTITDPTQAGGNTRAIELGRQKTGLGNTDTTDLMTQYQGLLHYPANQQTNDYTPRTIQKGDKIFFDIWTKFIYKENNVTVDTGGRPQTLNLTHTIMYRLVLFGSDNSKYWLKNEGNTYTWVNVIFDNDVFKNTGCFFVEAKDAVNYNAANDTTAFWYNFKKEFPEAPVTGSIAFMICGLATKPRFQGGGGGGIDWPSTGDWALDMTIQVSYDRGTAKYTWVPRKTQYPQITGVFLGVIPSGEDVPEKQDYIYNNTNPLYTLQVDPIEVFNGDVDNDFHQSRIIVPTNLTGKNFWDDLSDTYGASSIGLLVCRQIMRQYQLPYRILEGSIKKEGASFGGVYTFDTIPDVKFVLQRGTFNPQKGYIEDATFVQISDDVLPDGGTEGGVTLEPDWQPTGETRCQTDGNGLNTGYLITEEKDMNQNSETYQDLREVVSVNTVGTCPIGEPNRFYFGSQTVNLNTSTLEFAPFFIINSKTVSIDFYNTDGNYLYFLHRKTVDGVGQAVERIYTDTSQNNVIENWAYLSDVNINGYLYRVLITDYVMAEFSNFTHYFEFANAL